MSTARFTCTVGASRRQCSFSVDRDTGLVAVRFRHERTRYELHLGDVAEMVYHRVAKERARASALERRVGGLR